MLATGCASTPSPPPTLGPGSRPALSSASDMARRLGLDLVSASARGAMLRNRGNTVSLFPDPRGRAFVNGRAVGKVGGIVDRAGTLYVPAATEQAIRAALVSVRAPMVTATRPLPTRPDRPTIPRPARGRIVVDAGHGGKDPGSTRRKNGTIDEKIVNLDTALALERHLKKAGIDVVMTRRSDVSVELEDRPAFGNRHRPDVFVSIHADSAPNRLAQGFTIFIAENPPPGALRAAELVRRELVRAGVKDRGVRRRDLRVVRKSNGPAMLIELGFLTNAWEGRQLTSRAYRDRLAAAIARGLVAYLGPKH
jgi:N-acetylmuramoyl-L-alanine amidase